MVKLTENVEHANLSIVHLVSEHQRRSDDGITPAIPGASFSKAEMTLFVLHVMTVPQTLTFFKGQASYLRGLGLRVAMVSSPGPLLDRFAVTENVAALAVPMSRDITPVADLVSLFRLVKLLRRHKPDIVHSHTPKAGLLGTLAARLARRKAVLSVFGLPQTTMSGARRIAVDLSMWVACALAHRVWCDSQSVCDVVLARRLCRRDKVFVLGSGSVRGVDAAGMFNPARFKPADRLRLRQELGIPADATVAGFVGRLVPDKGIEDLAAAWRVLRPKYPQLHLLLVGEYESRRPINADGAHSLTGGRVHFVGYQEDVTPFFAIMDVFVMPSHREGFCLTNIEAAAFGLPVVATRIPGCVDSVSDGRTGTLVPPRDPLSLAAAVARYVDSSSLRQVHGDWGRERVEKEFAPDQIWSELASVYKALAERLDVPSGHVT
jgi:glycosyltransferase involved in cell wall biosynthesis